MLVQVSYQKVVLILPMSRATASPSLARECFACLTIGMYLLLRCVYICFSNQFSKIPMTIGRQEHGCIVSLPAVGLPTSDRQACLRQVNW